MNSSQERCGALTLGGEFGVSLSRRGERGLRETMFVPNAAQGFKSPQDQRRLLLVNKRAVKQRVQVPADAVGGSIAVVDSAAQNKARTSAIKTTTLSSRTLELQPFAIATVTFP
jgi:hypothetical protein